MSYGWWVGAARMIWSYDRWRFSRFKSFASLPTTVKSNCFYITGSGMWARSTAELT